MERMTESLRAIHLGAGPEHDGRATPPGRESDLLTIECEPDVESGLERIEAGTVECVLVDEALVRDGDVTVLERVGAVDDRLPVLVDVGADAASPESLPAGATDVVRLSGEGAPPPNQVTRIENAAIRYRTRHGADAADGERVESEGDSSDPARAHRSVEHAEYERLFAELGQSIFVADADGEFTYVNPAGAKITGYSAAEMIEGGPEMLFDGDELQTFYEAIESLATDDDREVTTVETTLEAKGGEHIPVEATMTLRADANGDVAGVVGVVRDVATERDTQRRLRENRTIMRAIPDEIVVMDTEGHITRVIPSIGDEVTTSGYTPEELEGMHVSEVMDEESFEQAADLLTEMITSDRDRATIEMQIVARDGERLWRESHFTVLENDEGKTLGSIGILRNIEERLAYERELERQNQRLEQFASITSHDLRNPLNLAQGYMDMVAEDCDSEHIETVDDALDRMGRLIEDTLTWARQGAVVDERRPVALASLVPECWAAVATDAAALDVADDVTIEGDPDRLRRLFENLLRNAVEHGGEDVTVTVGALDDGTGFFVEDDGSGIPADEREAVFEAGITTADDGTGFGLAIVAEVVEAHGWGIAVTESEAGGARFEITGVDLGP